MTEETGSVRVEAGQLRIVPESEHGRSGRPVRAWLSDMDGVLIDFETHRAIPGAAEFVRRFAETDTPLLLVTNNCHWTADDLAERLAEKGIDIPAGSIYTSAMATGDLIAAEHPGATVYVVGDDAVKQACAERGLTLLPEVTDVDADYVVIAELQYGLPQVRNPVGPDRTDAEVVGQPPKTIDLNQLNTAGGMVSRGARFVATNPDLGGPSPHGQWHYATGAWAEMVGLTVGVRPRYMGKPEPHLLQTALQRLGVEADEVVMVGDTMSTDIAFGDAGGTQTALVLSGSTPADLVEGFGGPDAGHRHDSVPTPTVDGYDFRPTRAFASVADLVDRVGDPDPLGVTGAAERRAPVVSLETFAQDRALARPGTAGGTSSGLRPSGTPGVRPTTPGRGPRDARRRSSDGPVR